MGRSMPVVSFGEGVKWVDVYESMLCSFEVGMGWDFFV